MERIESEYLEFLAKHDRGVVNRVKLDKLPKVGDAVFNRYNGNGIVVKVKDNGDVYVNFDGKLRIVNVKYLWKP